ncbi:LOW QUALITY PROTEIN: Alpha/Beta hydrolase protein [Microdochium trichocladiopsis]|uniref:Alpha/Beta hydrolase protein n=1 Tax=Microdochium trichocladiopsis TaxID=1682393 RepID=A0A9P8XT37_9PEZI|nr:LOW QUALITY PROTEIN: Alpha/Beta hydrolase protein [Microdochium trichocladiopsis]KAH7010784.1 LOW QUALITY PROTEIN: Alpha/Beta hydrolase protein [Microdochium trichocladiopsis]
MYHSPTYIVEPTTTHTHSIIFLHGLGDNGRNFGAQFLEAGHTSTGHLLPQLLPGARFIFPPPRSAELEPVIQAEVDKVGARNVVLGGISNGSAISISLLLAIGGGSISLGGLCSYLPFQRDILEAVTGERGGDEELGDNNPFTNDNNEDEGDKVEKGPAARAVEFERDLLCMEPLKDLPSEGVLATTPVFLGHGELDEKKPPTLGKAAADTLRAAGFNITWKLYPELGH